MKLFFYLTVFIISNFILGSQDVVKDKDIIFVVRADYLKGNPKFNKSNEARSYMRQQIYNYFVSKLKSGLGLTAQQQLAVAQLINKHLQTYIAESLAKQGLKLDQIEDTFLPNSQEFDKNLKEIENYKKLEEFLDSVMQESVLNKFEILVQPTKSMIVGAIPFLKSVLPAGYVPYEKTINEKTFLLLNQYLRLCYYYGLYLLSMSKSTVEKKLSHIACLQDYLIEFNKILSLPDLTKIVNLEFIKLKSPKKIKTNLVESRKSLSTLDNSLGSLQLRFEQLK